jgi:hypothetical protein
MFTGELKPEDNNTGVQKAEDQKEKGPEEIMKVTERISVLQKRLLSNPKFKGLLGAGMFKDSVLSSEGTLNPDSLSDKLIKDFDDKTGTYDVKGEMFEESALEHGVDLLTSLQQFEDKIERVVDKFEKVLEGKTDMEDLLTVDWNKDTKVSGSSSEDAPVGKVPVFMKELYKMGEENPELQKFCNLAVNFLFIVNKIITTKIEQQQEEQKEREGLKSAA